MSEVEVFRAHSIDKEALRRVSKPICHPTEPRRDHLMFAVSIGCRSPYAAEQVSVSHAVTPEVEIHSGEKEPTQGENSVTPEFFMGREVVRCRKCQLNQFMTGSGMCRKCRFSLAPEPVKDVRPIVAKPEQTIRLMGNVLDRADICFAIKLLRMLNGYSQKALADILQVPRSYISKLDNRKCVPNLENIEKIAIALNVTPYILVTFAELACAA